MLLPLLGSTNSLCFRIRFFLFPLLSRLRKNAVLAVWHRRIGWPGPSSTIGSEFEYRRPLTTPVWMKLVHQGKCRRRFMFINENAKLLSPTTSLVAFMGLPMLMGLASCKQEVSIIQSFNKNWKFEFEFVHCKAFHRLSMLIIAPKTSPLQDSFRMYLSKAYFFLTRKFHYPWRVVVSLPRFLLSLNLKLFCFHFFVWISRKNIATKNLEKSTKSHLLLLLLCSVLSLSRLPWI